MRRFRKKKSKDERREDERKTIEEMLKRLDKKKERDE